MAKLRDSQKEFIVSRLAMFDTLTEVAEAFQEEYGIKMLPSQVTLYDPTRNAGKDLAKRWIDHFHATRKQFQDNVLMIPLANQSNRVRELEKNYFYFKKIKNFVQANATLEQIGKETGGAFTNKIRADHTTNGKDMPANMGQAVINLTGLIGVAPSEPAKSK